MPNKRTTVAAVNAMIGDPALTLFAATVRCGDAVNS
jgi:hypothetical protein